MHQVLENCLQFKYISVDTEGFAPNPLGISVCNPALQGMYFPIGHKEDVNIDAETYEFLVHVLKTVPYRVFQYAGHDITILPFLRDLPFVCTMIMAHMINENLLSKSLDYLGKFYVGEGKKQDPLMESIIKSMGWEWVPFELMNLYAEWDAILTMKLFQVLLPLFEEEYGPLWSS